MSKRHKLKKERAPLTPRRKKDLGAGSTAGLDSPTQFFGFADRDSVCMASEVLPNDLADLADGGITASPGEWVISSGGHDSPGGIRFHGPFTSMEAAFAAGAKTYGVMTWRSPTQAL
jgi:hypothetical protein